MELVTYFDFADNDYRFFMFNYKHNCNDSINAMGPIAQGICERYMKHLIDLYYAPTNNEEETRKASVLRTHNLSRLINFLDRYMNVNYSDDTETKMRVIDGYYFSTRYPGEDSMQLTRRDVDRCADAVQACREETIKIENELGERMNEHNSIEPSDDEECL